MEKYEPYIESDLNLPPKVHYWNLTDSGDGFRIKVYSTEMHKQIIDIYFSRVYAFRSLDEGDRLKLWNDIELSDRDFIFTVENSEFLKYFNEQSYETHDSEELKHYFIVTTDDCIDVISSENPNISMTMQA